MHAAGDIDAGLATARSVPIRLAVGLGDPERERSVLLALGAEDRWRPKTAQA